MSSVDPLVARLWFENVDTDRSGLLDAKELRNALSLGGLDFPLAQVHLFVRAFDSKGNQKLNLDEFMELHRFLDAVQETFRRLAGGSRTLASAGIREAIRQMGYSLDGPAVDALLSRFDSTPPQAPQGYEVDSLLRICLRLRTAARAFAGFDLSRTGVVKFSFNQYLYAASHLA